MRFKLSHLTCVVLMGVSTSSFALVEGEIAGVPVNTTITTSGGSSSGGSVLNNTTTSQDSCDTITTSVNESLMERWKSALPKSENDNVSTAVKESEAVNVNNQTVSTSSLSIKDLFSNPFDFIKEAATKLYDAAIEKAKDFLKNAYANAISSVTFYVNNMYAEQLAKYSSKMGSIGGSILTNSLGQFVPSINNQLSTCATNVTSQCLSQTMDQIGKSASDAANRAMQSANYNIQQTTSEVISDVNRKADSEVTDAINKVGGK